MGQDVHRAQAADDPSLIVQVEIGRTESGQSSACRANFPSLQSWEIITVYVIFSAMTLWRQAASMSSSLMGRLVSVDGCRYIPAAMHA